MVDTWCIALMAFSAVLIFYHTSEPLITYIYNRSDFGRSSFLFSAPYCFAMGVALTEFFIELIWFPSIKKSPYFMYAGIILVIFGEFLRKGAMLTAKESFTHLIKVSKRKEHVLVTEGVYKFIRHPGYLGWFIWAPSTQLILMNPISFGLFLSWAWYFFYDRIPYEEQYLINMFGEEYINYKARTKTWIPFIN
ncbi:protein-S-isoprenylcysteine O-methyltransferase [Acrasis kona]|uniref:Protein-S-isoprenylcysteine O-methyltransferase n=1 Tax=Acrasis kona TaxID=1008807 RepID=A0AAW2YRE8_9EUKA